MQRQLYPQPYGSSGDQGAGRAQGGHEGAQGNPNVEYARVEIRPGAFHMVEVPKRGAGPGFRPNSAPVGRTGSPGAGARGSPVPTARGSPGGPGVGRTTQQYNVASEVAPLLARIEEAMREQVKSRSALHVTERTVLLSTFGKVLGKRPPHITHTDKVTPSQFASVWQALGVGLGQDQTHALFNKHGADGRGNLGVLGFVDALVAGAPRALMIENDVVQRGAWKAGAPATHAGKIKYPQCKKGVWPPSGWDPRLAERSAQLPDARLTLEFVYGYDGMQATSNNVFYTATGEVAYFAAAVGIVYNKQTHTQRFFLEHDDDITSMAIHPDRRTVATGQVGKDPVVIVWDSITCTALATIRQGYGNRGVQALCFSPDGTMLAAVCTDNAHTLYLWIWPKKQLLMERKTYNGAPPATYGLVWSPFEPSRFTTWGQNHIKFWRLADGVDSSGMRTCDTQSGSFAGTKTHTPLSACFLPSGIVLSGNQDGAIVSWKGNKLVRETPGHGTGAIMKRPDGTKMYSGVRCLVLQNVRTLLSGGADGYVIKWDVSSGDLGPKLQKVAVLRPDQLGVVSPPALRALDCLPGSEVFIAGSGDCDLWEVVDTPEVLVQGANGSLNGLAMNPAYPHVFATLSEADTVVVMSSATRRPLRVVHLGTKGDCARSGAFSPDGQHLAVGLAGGGIKVMQFHPQVTQLAWCKDTVAKDASIDELKYSPCGRFLAAGSHDQFIYIYDVSSGYKLRTKISGHSSTITHIDWSADSTVLMSNDQAYEILYSDPRTGQMVKENQRDTHWATWTCVLGFPVMGVWPHDSDGTDVNACDRSPSGRYLLSADDFGRVKLFNFPVVVEHAPALVYPGHSSHVPNVRWAADESYACSVGGRDRCTFQFRVGVPPAPPRISAMAYAPLDQRGVEWGSPSVANKQAHAQARAGGAGGGAGGGARAGVGAAQQRPQGANKRPGSGLQPGRYQP
ncbi:hypothetical protein FOA52_003891 [Chlamydomonas sp. UWO 241]|nr:hypothetical protein FOA52_003891 [Chlamydomonas sp. UWO 241]